MSLHGWRGRKREAGLPDESALEGHDDGCPDEDADDHEDACENDGAYYFACGHGGWLVDTGGGRATRCVTAVICMDACIDDPGLGRLRADPNASMYIARIDRYTRHLPSSTSQSFRYNPFSSSSTVQDSFCYRLFSREGTPSH